MMGPTPAAAFGRFPLEGATPAARRSRFRGVRLIATRRPVTWKELS